MPVLDCIGRCLSFINASLYWIEHSQVLSAQFYADTPNPPKEQDEPPPVTGYIWEGTISDLIELSVAIHKLKLIRKSSGQLITYAEIIRALQIIFDIKIPNIYSRKTRAMERKKNASPLLERMLALYRQEVEKIYQ